MVQNRLWLISYRLAVSARSDLGVTLGDFTRSAKAEITEIDGVRLEAMRKDNPGLLLVDVREAGEHAQGHLEGALLRGARTP